MSLKPMLLALAAAAIVTTPSHAEEAAAGKALPGRTNLLLIVLDDLNTDFGAYGGQAKTPHMDRLASQAVRFDSAYSVVPACNPSRVALLTGQRPETTGQYANPGDFRQLPGGAGRITLPQFLRQNGYEAVAAGKVFHHPRGAQPEREPLSDAVSWDFEPTVSTGIGDATMLHDATGGPAWLKGATEFEGQRISPYLRREAVWGPIPVKKEDSGDFQIASFCADFLNQPRGKPFMLACGLSRPHSPHIAPQEFFDLYPLDKVKLPTVRNDDLEDVPRIARRNFSTSFVRALKAAGEQEWRRAVQGYLASTSFADEAVGRILDGLERSPHRDNTVVVLIGDHGFQVGQKERWEKFTLWDLGGRTAFLMKLPGVTPRVVKPAVSFLDIYPTVLSALGIKRPGFLEGNDLSPLIANPDADWGHAAVSTYEPGNNSVRWGPWNYIRYRDGTEELYHLPSDPHEFNNLVARGRGEHVNLIERLARHLPRAAAPMQSKPSM